MVAQKRISAVVGLTILGAKLGLNLSVETVPNHLLFEARSGTTLLVYGGP